MKKLLKSLLVLALAAGVVACGSSENSEGVTLTIGTSPDYEPYENKNTDGTLYGFDIDMVELFEKYLTEEEGVQYNLEFKEMDFDNIITQIQGDQVDLGISGFTYSEDRVVEWSQPYTATAQVAVLKKGTDITSVAQLEGKSIVAQTGATGEQAANDIKDAKVTGLKNVQDMFNALAANQYDAAIVDLAVAQTYVNSGNFVMIDETLMDEQNFIIAKQGNTEVIEKINKCIEKFLASEDYNTLCEKYGLKKLDK